MKLLGYTLTLTLVSCTVAQAQMTDEDLIYRYESRRPSVRIHRHGLVAERAPYREVTSGALMIYSMPQVGIRGKAARIIGVSRYGRKLFLLDEFSRGEPHGREVPYLTNRAAEEARQAILRGTSINLSACLVPGRELSRGAEIRSFHGETCQDVTREIVFDCSVFHSTPLLGRVHVSAYELIDLDVTPGTVTGPQCTYHGGMR